MYWPMMLDTSRLAHASLPCRMRIGRMICTCWPTIAVISGERVSVPARASWKRLGTPAP